MYPLAEFDGTLKTTDWTNVPSFGKADATGDQGETQWVDPVTFFDVFPEVLDEVPPLPGEEAMHAWFRSLTDAAATDPAIAEALRSAAVEANDVVQELFEFRNIGIPSAHNWSTQCNGAEFGTDFLSRTAMGKANIFVNTPNETAYYYQDRDESGARLNGANTYSLSLIHISEPTRPY